MLLTASFCDPDVRPPDVGERRGSVVSPALRLAAGTFDGGGGSAAGGGEDPFRLAARTLGWWRGLRVLRRIGDRHDGYWVVDARLLVPHAAPEHPGMSLIPQASWARRCVGSWTH